MPISEIYDYIQLINNQIEEEKEANSKKTFNEKSETPMLSDVYRGPFN